MNVIDRLKQIGTWEKFFHRLILTDLDKTQTKWQILCLITNNSRSPNGHLS